MSTTRQKIVRCPIHGYIDLPESYFRRFVDTPVFQRLREISQTSLEQLFPSAQHTRFSHSIGTFYLARSAFTSLVDNPSHGRVNKSILKTYRTTFLVAALLHDCAHSAFSHGLERYYDSENYAKDTLIAKMRPIDASFKFDYDFLERRGHGASPHELFSSIIFLEFFRDEYEEEAKESAADQVVRPELIVRMITGCLYGSATTQDRMLENCLIKLINGLAIDVDKLDYVVRDMWASGIKNVQVDMHRLLSALHVGRVRSQLEPVYRKSALSVIESVVEGRNYLYRWLYSHHIIIYFTELLDTAIQRLFALLSTTGGHVEVIRKLFQLEIFKRPVDVGGFRMYLPTDGDFRFLLKHHKDHIPEMEELLSREPKRTPLWKSTAEFDQVFNALSDVEIARVRGLVKQILKDVLGISDDDAMVVDANPKLVTLAENEVLVSVRGEILSYPDAVPYATRIKPKNRFYVYIPMAYKDAKIKEKAIKALVHGAYAAKS